MGLKNKMTVIEFQAFMKTKEGSKKVTKRKQKKSKRAVNDDKLWKAFSEYIRLKYSNEKGFCTCYTCGGIRFWRNCDAGHGIGRQHMATKFEEVNVRPQCKPCNGFHGGKREAFKERMDQEHGAGTWEGLELMAKQVFKYSQFEVDELEKFYKAEVKKLLLEKEL